MIECPHCHKTFELDEAVERKLEAHLREEMNVKFAGQLREKQEQMQVEFRRRLEEQSKVVALEEAARLKREFDEKTSSLQAINEASLKKLQEFQKREADFEVRRQSMESEINQKIQQKLAQERLEAEKRARAEQELIQSKIAAQFEDRMTVLQLENTEKEQKFREMRQRELELEAEKRRILLEFEETEHRKRLAFEDEKAKAERQMKEKMEIEFSQKLLEKESQIEAMRRNAETLQKQARQGLARNQGEAQEEFIKRKLLEYFPGDRVEDIKTGARGADLKLYVFSEMRVQAGLILIESKNAENFTKAWLDKLRQDRERENADLAVLVTTVFPDKMDHFGQRDGVWICSPEELVPMLEVLRVAMIDIAKTRASMQGLETKAGQLYEYLTSMEFGQRVGTVLNTFRQLKEQLETERTAFEKQWAAREKMLSVGSRALASAFGQIGGIAGKDLPEVDQLKLGE